MTDEYQWCISCCFCNTEVCETQWHFVDEYEDEGVIGGICKRYACDDCYETCNVACRTDALWEIAQVVATQDTTYADDFMNNYCIFCHGEENYEDSNNYKHEDTCIVLKARALVAQKCSE